jgi:glycosyltransferase involved in cell wall biosynthesis
MSFAKFSSMKIVIFAHGHPRFNPGGGEHAAFALFKLLQEQANVEAWFVAASNLTSQSFGTSIASLNPYEILIPRANCDFFYHAATGLGESSELRAWINQIQPDVLHFHHFVHLGTDLILALLGLFPNATAILTLHEYLTICAYKGQLLRKDGRICTDGPNIPDCSQCVPNHPAINLAMRSVMMESMLAKLDHLISPSTDLAQRLQNHIELSTQISVIENPLLIHPKLKQGQYQIAGGTASNLVIFGYFGQIHSSKGLHIIIKAFKIALKENPNIYLAIHGTDIYTENHPDGELQKYFDYIKDLIQPIEEHIYFHGPYVPAELEGLISNVQWMVMGSIWYENSPVVIQEAFLHRCPLLVPCLGGMAEKVRDGLDGYHYMPRSPISLANIMKLVSSHPQYREKIISTLQNPLNNSVIINSHLKLYQESIHKKKNRKT